MLKCKIYILFFFASSSTFAQSNFIYPLAISDTVIDTYHGQKVVDPYRYFENSNDSKTLQWLGAQENLTQSYKKKSRTYSKIYDDFYNLIFTDLEKNKVEKENLDTSNYYFEQRTLSIGANADLYYKKGEKGNYKLLLRSKWFKNYQEDVVGFSSFNLNKEKSKMVFSISHSGTEWEDLYVYDFINKELLSDEIIHLRNDQIVWNEFGFYYLKTNRNSSKKTLSNHGKNEVIYYHELNSDSNIDKIVLENQDTTGVHGLSIRSIEDNELILEYPLKSRGKWYRAIATINIENPKSFVPRNFLVVPFGKAGSFSVVASFGDSIILNTNLNASKHKLLYAKKQELNSLEEFLPEKEATLEYVNRLGKEKLACFYLEKGTYSVLVIDSKGNDLKNFNFPEGTNVSGFYADDDERYAYYAINSFYFPRLKFKLDLKTLTSESVGKLSVPFDYKKFRTEYITYTSKDGTEVSMYLTYNKSTRLNGENPTLIYGYGGYGYTITPYYSRENVVWLNNGGVLAVPNIRGGGAKGSGWAKSGRNLNKQNAIDDFISAAEHLIAMKLTNPKKLVVEGSSHGGLLVGAAITQRPDLFNTAIIEAGPLDLIRSQNFFYGISAINLNEYGNVNKEEEFSYMYNYSPLHKIKNGIKYPSTLLISGKNDTRVSPFHSYKFLASLQSKANKSSFYMMHLINNSGHTGPDLWKDELDYNAFKFYFIFNTLDLNYKELNYRTDFSIRR